MRWTAWAMAVGLLVVASEAGATSFCAIKPTSDGFVALRAEPNASSGLVARMRVGDEVQLLGETSGRFERVLWWKGDTRLSKGYEAISGTGWVHASLIVDCG